MGMFKGVTFAIILLVLALTPAAFANPTSMSWYLTGTNTQTQAPCTLSAPCAEVTLSINSTGDQATFTVSSLLTGYQFALFGFNGPTGLGLNSATGTIDTTDPKYGLSSAGGTLDGWGSFAYIFDTGINGGSTGSNCTVTGGIPGSGCTFSFTLDGVTGLSLSSFEVPSSGGTGSGYFAGHLAAGNGNTGYVGSPTPVPEPTSMVLFGSGLVGLVGILKRRRLLGR